MLIFRYVNLRGDYLAKWADVENTSVILVCWTCMKAETLKVQIQSPMDATSAWKEIRNIELSTWTKKKTVENVSGPRRQRESIPDSSEKNVRCAPPRKIK